MSSLVKSKRRLTDAMKTYNVKVKKTAEKDIDSIADFLFDILSPEGAYRYLDVIGQEIKSLSIYADCYTAVVLAPFDLFIRRLGAWCHITTSSYMFFILKMIRSCWIVC